MILFLGGKLVKFFWYLLDKLYPFLSIEYVAISWPVSIAGAIVMEIIVERPFNGVLQLLGLAYGALLFHHTLLGLLVWAANDFESLISSNRNDDIYAKIAENEEKIKINEKIIALRKQEELNNLVGERKEI